MDELTPGASITITAVKWDSDAEKFVTRDVVGTVDEYNVIKFERRTMDCYCVPLYKLGEMYRRWESGNDCDVVFCLSTHADVRQAMRVWEHYIFERVADLEHDLQEQQDNLLAIKRYIRQNEKK